MDTSLISAPLAGQSSQQQVGSPLQNDEIRQAQRELRRRRWRSFLFVTPLLAFLLFAFVAPITTMLYRSVHDPVVVNLIPKTVDALSEWDGANIPPDQTLATMATELKTLSQERKAGSLGSAVNRMYPGASSLINATARRMQRQEDTLLAERGASLLLDADKRWGTPELWHAMKSVGREYTDTYFLTALDMERGQDGSIQQRSSARIYVQLFTKTLGMALVITVLCILLAYPVSYYLARIPRKAANMLMILVLLPFWTSLLVRTTSWIALLQLNGVVNSTLLSLGLISEPLEILYTQYATIIAMTHILLPFMILPLYSVMRGIDGSYMRAALSMGSSTVGAFLKIYLPLTLPGLSAGALLVFIISVGYYITPALVGGTDGQMISNLIAFHMQQSNNWGLAAALGTLLLALILLLYWIYDRLVGAGSIKLG